MTWASGGAAAIVVVAVALAACAHESPPPPLRTPAPAPTSESSCHHALPACAGAAPTYARDVRPILERRCFKCHTGEGVAADEHDFSHVETLRAQKRALANEIGACAMPPAPEPSVPDAEAAVLLRWVVCGGEG